MRKSFLLLMAMCFATLSFAEKNVTLRDVMHGGYWPQTYAAIKPMADGEHFARMSDDRSMILKGSFKNGEIVDTLFNAATARGFDQKRIDGYQFSPDETLILLQTKTKPIYRNSFTAEHYIYNRNNNKVDVLSSNGAQQVPKFSPDGKMIAFVRDNNIHLVKLMFGNSESQVTTDGEYGKIINGIPDWVNEEEFMTNCSYDFSADSKVIAYIKYDESEVMMYDMPMYSGGQSKEYFDFSKPYSFKYPVAGADNAKVSVHSFDIKSRVTRQLDVNIPEEGYIPRIKFTKDPNMLAVLTLNRHQSVLEIQAVNPLSGVSKTILREESDTYLNEQTYSGIEFLDKHFVFQSERSGFNQLYLYNLAGELVRPITTGDYEVKKFYGWDSKKNEFYYSSNEGSPLRESIYKVNAKGKKTKLSKREGTNSAVFSNGMKYFINTYSSIDTPHTVTINDNSGKELKTLIDNKELKERLAQFDMPTKEFFTFTTERGDNLNAYIIKPVDFDPNKKYPTLLFCEGGPQSVVSQFWSYRWNFQLMAAEGYVVVAPNRRGLPSFGQEWLDQISGDYSGQNIRDYLAAIDDVAAEPWSDEDRLGAVGASYGGYSVYYLAGHHEGRFKALISHCGIFNFESMYGHTEELFFVTNDYGGAYWDMDNEVAQRSYANSPHKKVANWNAPIMIITGEKDYRIPYSQSLEAFTAARVQGIDARLVSFENEAHQVFQPQNSVVWNREFFDWLNKYLK